MRRGFFITLLIVIGIFANYYYRQLTGQASSPIVLQESQILEAYLNTLQSTQLNEQGALSHRLQADKAEKYSDTEDLIIDHPILNLEDEEPGWQVSAEQAIANQQQDTIKLQGQVLLERHDGQARLETDYLTLDNSQNKAFTDADVELQFNGSTTQAQGFIIDMNKESVHLPANVRSTYSPPQKN